MALLSSSSAVDPEPTFDQVPHQQEPRDTSSQRRYASYFERDSRRRSVHFESPVASDGNLKTSSPPPEIRRPGPGRMAHNHRKTASANSGYLDLEAFDAPFERPSDYREEKRDTRCFERSSIPCPPDEKVHKYDPKNPWTWPKIEKRPQEVKNAQNLLTPTQLGSLWRTINAGVSPIEESKFGTKGHSPVPSIQKEVKPQRTSQSITLPSEQKKPFKDPYDFPRLPKKSQKSSGANPLREKKPGNVSHEDGGSINHPFRIVQAASFQNLGVATPVGPEKVPTTKKQKKAEVKTMLKQLEAYKAQEESSHYDGYATIGRIAPLPPELNQRSPTANAKVSGWDMDPSSVPHSSVSISPKPVSRANLGGLDASDDGWNRHSSVGSGSRRSEKSNPSDRTKTHSSMDSRKHDEKQTSSRTSSAESKGRDKNRTTSGDAKSYDVRGPRSRKYKNRDGSKTSSGRTKTRSSHRSQLQLSVPAGSVLYGSGDVVAGAERWNTSEGLSIDVGNDKVSPRRTESSNSISPSSRRDASEKGSGSKRGHWGGLEPIPEDKPFNQTQTCKIEQTARGEAVQSRERSQSHHSHESQRHSSYRAPGSKTSYQSPMVEDDPENWKGWESADANCEKATSIHSKKDVKEWDGSVKAPSQTGHILKRAHSGYDEPIKAWHSGKVPSDLSHGTGYAPRQGFKQSSKHETNSGNEGGGSWKPSLVPYSSLKSNSRASIKNEAEGATWVDSPIRSVSRKASSKGSKKGHWGGQEERNGESFF
jgi:hypothetical protein